MTTPAVRLEHITKRQGRFGLGPLDFEVPTGAIYALVGPNGAGKSTLIDLLVGIGRPDRGRIQLLGMDLEQDEVSIKRRVAYFSPDLQYQAWINVGRAIDFVSGFYPDWDSSRCERLLVEFGLSREEPVAPLSFGARTKLALTMVLSRNADLLLLDEPTTGLDATSKQVLFRELLNLMRSEEKTIVISSHQLTDLERFADHVGILHQGRLLISGRMDTLIERFCEVEVQLPSADWVGGPGLKLLSQTGNRASVLVDRVARPSGIPIGKGINVIGESGVTLEELFLGLVQESGSVAVEGPR